MKKLSLFESLIIGLFVGVVVATYLVFMYSTGGFVGQILSWISLVPVLGLFNFPIDKFLSISFVFFVLVYTIYGFIVGSIIRNSRKMKVLFFIILLLLVVAIYFEQVSGMATQSKQQGEDIPVLTIATTTPPQYFGKIEAEGDLNSDNKDDVAFVIPRIDTDTKGLSYYLTTALSSGRGHVGTNLIFLGNKVDPQKIDIENEQITVEYIDDADKNASSTKKMYFKVVKNVLVEDNLQAKLASSTESSN